MVRPILKKFFSKPHNMNAIPDGYRVYAIGDIHGCLDHLDDLLAKIDTDNVSAKAARKKDAHPFQTRLVFLGDYIDRGPDSPGVIDRLVEIQKSEQDVVFLMGNHERVLLDFLEDPHDNYDWLNWGGEETLRGYGIERINSKEPQRLAEELSQAIAPDHLTFLRELEIRHEFGDYVFVHAGLRPGIALDEQTSEDQLWIREDFFDAEKKDHHAQTVIHGHTVVKKVVDTGWRVCVDTGAVWTGVLTAVVLEGQDRKFIATKPNPKK